MVRGLTSFFGIFVFVFIIAALPKMLMIQYNEIHFGFYPGWYAIKEFFKGITTGTSFHYHQGMDRERSFFQDAPRYFKISYLYLISSSFFAVLISTFVGTWQGRSKHGWLKDILGFLSAIPDFILILLLQMGVAIIYESTGIRVAKAASMSTENPAILLPLITLTLIPTVYLIRTLSEHTYDELTENYILTARSKGMGKIYILFRHALRNILPFLKADLHKVVAIMIGNLFIVEYLFNIRGLTRLIFSKYYSYQYDLVICCLFSFIVLYFTIYWTMRLFVFGLERIFAND